MGAEGLVVVALTLLVVIVLVTERATLDVVGLGLLVTLVGAGELLRLFDPQFDPAERLLGASDAFAFFGNNAVLVIAALYVVGEGLSRTGALEFFARAVVRSSGGKQRVVILMVCLIAGVCSAFLNNTAVVLVFIPVLIDMASRTGIPVSRLLMPMAFATILGGMCTLVGTSTNLLVSGVAESLGHAPIGMFELSPVGLPLLLGLVGLLVVFGPRFLPDRYSLTAMMAGAGQREYVTELTFGPSSPQLGRKYSDAFNEVRADLLFFARGEEMVWPPYFNETIEAGDVVMLRGGVDELAALQDELKLKLFNEARFDAKSMQFFELAVAPQSALVGRQVGDLHLWRDFGAITVAVLRNNQHIRERASKQVLQPGDLLLMCGDDTSQARLRASSDFYLLSGAHKWIMMRGKARRALVIVVALMAAFSALSLGGRGDLLPLAALGGAVAMVVTGCLRARRAYRAIDWSILMFLIGTIGLGRAMENSGVASLVAGGIVHALDGFGPQAIFGGLTLLCALLSSVISNQAVAVLLTPIALSAAGTIVDESGLGADAAAGLTRAFLLGIALSASVCFATPIGHQSSLMVYGPGGYRWSDFLRIGVPVSLIAWIGICVLVPWFTGGF